MEASRRMRRLKARRLKAGIRQMAVARGIADRSGWRMTQPTFSVIESGSIPAPAGFISHYERTLIQIIEESA